MKRFIVGLGSESSRCVTEFDFLITILSTFMKNRILFPCLLGLLVLSSCEEDIVNEPLLFDEPGIDFVSVERDGVRDMVISCKMRPTREMYDNHFYTYECGIEYSTDSLFRRSVKVSFGHPERSDYLKVTWLSDLFPDSTYYFKPLLINAGHHMLPFYSYSTDRHSNRYLSDTDTILCSGNVVTVNTTPFDVDDHVTVEITKTAPMSISYSMELTDGIVDCTYSVWFSDDSLFSDGVKVIEYKPYLRRNETDLITLNSSSNYYIRPCIGFKSRTDTTFYFGNTIKVQTEALPQKNGMEYVDLGLSVMWAFCNVDAVSPEEPGGYYCWGETEELTVNGVRVETIDYVNTILTYSKYNSTDQKRTLDSADDVAAVKWGGPWHIPDQQDILDLWANSEHFKEVTINGKKVLKVISKINGNFIYLPIAGYYAGGSYLDWPQAYIWSRNLSTLKNEYGIAKSLRSDSFDGSHDNVRSDCLNVRPVFKP